MGIYLNPGHSGFEEVLNSYYVDKTGLIKLVNTRINTPDKLVCISRPRRFGKSYAAQMLCAYYDHTCDSHNLFAGKDISCAGSYEDHINKYQVIYLDMSNLLGKVKPEFLIQFIEENVTTEILCFNTDIKKGTTFDQTLINAAECIGKKFIMIIDEWDAPIREAPQITKEYLLFLRMLFKSSNTTAKIFAAAYMTGILPIKKDGTQSAISNFDEYSFLEPGDFAQYTGFTEDEVKKLCDEYHVDFLKVKKWYDGYTVGNVESVYNPYSVMSAIKKKKFTSYWRYTSATDNLLTYINLDLKREGLQDDIARLIGGETIEIDTSTFKNDVADFAVKDDVLTLLVHLGYLAYEQITELYGEDEQIIERVRIPNEEVRIEFKKMLSMAEHPALVELFNKSKKLLEDTKSGNEEAVAKTIEQIRHTNYAPQFYNNEQSLRYVIKFAYIVCIDKYMRIEELPSGKGFADVVFVPKRGAVDPAIVVELKWDKSTDSAIKQIKDKNYPAVLTGYCGELILVGINYDSKTGKHSCKIEKITI